MGFARLIYIALTSVIIIVIISCKSRKEKITELYRYKEVYMQAVSYNDYYTAADAIYDLLAEDTSNTLSYKDSLTSLYFRQRQYIRTIGIGKEILAKFPDDIMAMELIALSDQQVNTFNSLNEALDYYRQLYIKTHNLYQLFQTASIQMSLNRLGECEQTVELIIDDTGSTCQSILLTVGDGQQQNVPYKAVALNMRGLIAEKLKQDDVAKSAFTDALTLSPDFALAKDNLAALGKHP